MPGSATPTPSRSTQRCSTRAAHVKADLERGLGQLVLDCSSCGRTVHWVPAIGINPDTERTGNPFHTANPPRTMRS
jgi:hypothetical protein